MAENLMRLEIPVRMHECSPDGKLRSHILFDYFQHIAAQHAELMGFGMSAIKEKQLIWVLSRIKMSIDELPSFDDVVEMVSYHNGVDRLFAKRQFIINSLKDGRRLGYGSSFWLTLELPSLRPRKPSDMLELECEENMKREEFFPFLDKLPVQEGVSDALEYRVGASQVDLNDHLNNSFYTAFTVDWLSHKLDRIVKLKEIQVNYNLAMKFQDKLTVRGVVSADGAFYVEGTASVSGKNSFQATGICC